MPEEVTIILPVGRTKNEPVWLMVALKRKPQTCGGFLFNCLVFIVLFPSSLKNYLYGIDRYFDIERQRTVFDIK